MNQTKGILKMEELNTEVEEITEESEVEDQINEDDSDKGDELEDWQKPVDTEDDESYTVDGELHQEMKLKLKGRVSERDEKISELEAKIAALESKQTTPESKVLKRPMQDDFGTDEEYHDAMVKYDEDLVQQVYDRNQLKSTQNTDQKAAIKKRDEEVASHYERAGELIKDSSITEELYQKADTRVRETIEAQAPKMGDVITDNIISILGKGSEKVMYYLGVNRPALNKFQELLKTDPSGMKAAVFLGQQKQKLTKPIKPRSNAPDPATTVEGDEKTALSGEEKRMKAEYRKIGAGTTESFNIKKKARAKGYDTSNW